VLLGDGQQSVFRGGASAKNRRTNPSTLFGYFLIRDPGATHLKLICAIGGKHQVGVCIHESRRHHSPLCVDDLGVLWQTRFDLMARPYCLDFAPTGEHGSISDDA
jgi:hypothetical protein